MHVKKKHIGSQIIKNGSIYQVDGSDKFAKIAQLRGFDILAEEVVIKKEAKPKAKKKDAGNKEGE